tara:strand:- start:1816 stop:2382 length:567 start_codon:yes stop_codon:yes gene_type:complete
MNKAISILVILISVTGSLFAAEAGMPQLDPIYWASQAFWLIVIFSLIFFLISKIFIPKIKNNIDSRENKIRKDLQEASLLREEADKKLKIYKELIEKGRMDAKKILLESRQKLSGDIQVKKSEIQKEIEKETKNAEKEIENFKKNSVKKINLISEEIASNLIENIFGEDLNKNSIKAAVNETMKVYKN